METIFFTRNRFKFVLYRCMTNQLVLSLEPNSLQSRELARHLTLDEISASLAHITRKVPATSLTHDELNMDNRC